MCTNSRAHERCFKTAEICYREACVSHGIFVNKTIHSIALPNPNLPININYQCSLLIFLLEYVSRLSISKREGWVSELLMWMIGRRRAFQLVGVSRRGGSSRASCDHVARARSRQPLPLPVSIAQQAQIIASVARKARRSDIVRA